MVKRAIVRKMYSLRSHAQRNAIPPSSLQFEDMNDDCLEHMFNFLDIDSLMKVCRVGQRVKDIVINRIIPLKTISFADVSSVRRVFALFGKSMTRIIVHSDDMQMDYPPHSQFDKFLRLLVMYDVPGRLQQVHLTFSGNEYGIPIDVLSVIGPYFENVHTLNFSLLNDHMRFFLQFMKAIPKHNLHTLNVHNLQVIGDWLVAEALPRLRKIHLCVRWGLYTAMADRIKIEELNETQLINFISSNSGSLVHVDFDCSKQDRIFVEMSQRMPNIEHLGTLIWRPGTAERVNDNGNAYLVRNQMYQEKWKYLNAYKNLKHIILASYVMDCLDLGEIFRILAVQNTIEGLTLSLGWHHTDGGCAIAITDLQRLSQLKTLNLFFFFNQNTTEFLSKLFENLPALTKCTIKSKGQKISQAFIENTIQVAQKLMVLVIYSEVDSFTPRFYKKLLEIRTSVAGVNDMENRLTIYFSEISIHDCIDMLGEDYKPSIIALKTTDYKGNFC